ncbi:MAG: glycosyltransferase [Acidobacteriota bacterium]
MAVLPWVLWGAVVFWALAVLNALLNTLLIPRLPRQGPEGAGLPSLTVVIPARNEEGAIARTVEAFCTQDYPGLSVVVVDDGSTDGTPEILAGLAARFPNLTVVRGEEPPPGWLGKPHAQFLGLSRARSQWILFADADVRYGPGVLRRAVGEALRRRLDFLLILSRLEARGLEHVLMANLDAFTFYVAPVFLANVQALRGFAFGAGSGNLVRLESLRKAGGLEAIRSEVVDDVAMGKAVKASGARWGFLTAFGDVRVRMYDGLASAMEGFTKNFFAFFNYRPLWAAFLMAGDLGVHTLPPLVFLLGLLLPLPEPAFLPATLGTAAGLALNGALCLWARKPLWTAPLYPLRPLLWTLVLLRSARRYYRQGVVWRGRRYGRKPPR